MAQNKTLNARISWKRDTSANWTSNDPVLLNGEIIIVDTAGGETRFKIGDGTKTYSQLPFEDEAIRNLISNLEDQIEAIDNHSKTIVSVSQSQNSGNKIGTITVDGNATDLYAPVTDLSDYATKANPTFTGTPKAPTAAANNNSTQIATTAYADRAATNAANSLKDTLTSGTTTIVVKKAEHATSADNATTATTASGLDATGITQVQNIKVNSAAAADTATTATTASGLDTTGVAQVKGIKVDTATAADTATTATTANKTTGTLTIDVNGTPTTFNGSANQTVNINAAALGLSGAMNFRGVVSSLPTTGNANGDVVLNGNKEYVWDGDSWVELGDESSHALKSVTITAGSGLTGGGTLEANRTISVNTGYTTTGDNYKVNVDSTSGGLYVDVSEKMDKNNPTGTGNFSLDDTGSITIGPRLANSTIGPQSMAIGYNNEASTRYSAAIGFNNHATGVSYAIGSGNTASGDWALAIGNGNIASGPYTIAQGISNQATVTYAHASGVGSIASDWCAYARGGYLIADGQFQYVIGSGNIAAPNADYMNIADSDQLFIVGNYRDTGSPEDNERSNAHTLDWAGNAWYAGDVYVGSTSGINKDEGSKKLATEEYVTNQLSNVTVSDGSTTQKGIVQLSDATNSTSTTLAATANAVKKAYDLAASKTANAGTVTSVSAGTGLTGGPITSSGSLSLASGVCTPGTYGPTGNVSGTNGTTIKVPQITVDTYGRVTGVTERTYTSVNTDSGDTKMTQTHSTSNANYRVLMTATSGTGTTSPGATTSVCSSKMYANPYTGAFTATSVYGAVWNDYAEYREGTEDFEPGRVICENGDDTLGLATERLQPGANVVSDTFGFAIGETEKAKTPIAVSGRVLVYPYEDRNSYKPGDAVCAAPGGTVSKMTREEIREYPERILGTVSAIPTYERWGEGNVPVNGRIWIKVR